MTKARVTQRYRDELVRSVIDGYEFVQLFNFGNGRYIVKHQEGADVEIMLTDPRGAFPVRVAGVEEGAWVTFTDDKGSIVNVEHYDGRGEIRGRFVQVIFTRPRR